jgi:TonB family protein
MFGSGPSKPAPAASEGHAEPVDPVVSRAPGESDPNESDPGESDLRELAAKFATHGGGNLSAELSAELALEVVLNEIVEQACLATGATGAAVILERDGEMVCRASSGVNAPELGARLGSESGLTAECIKTRQVQRCDDAQADPRADVEASRSLGVRSVVVLPLLRNNGLAGVLEVFSSRSGAFRERDELTLEALAGRILKNLARAREPFLVAQQSPVGLPVSASRAADAAAFSATSMNEESGVTSEAVARGPRSGFDVVTLALAVAVLAFTVLLGTLVVLRLGSRGTVAVPGQTTKSASGADRGSRDGLAQADNAQHAAGTEGKPGEKKDSPAPSAVRSSSLPPEGSLSVYENGKEIFRMAPAAQGDAGSATAANGAEVRKEIPKEVQRASTVEPAEIIEVPAAEAEASLLQRVEPEYPAEARQRQMQGAVVLEVRIGRDGTVQDVNLVSGQQALADAAIAAVKQWRFKPRILQGQPVEMQTRVTLNFRMPG